ncbi:hypothetical protein Trichorick_01127 [Candidatus Trichorickettsia mobilis]|uniref:Lipoprotein n=1 Tax=Candidatus Trichorickettsia mobilis TaxID=1346319 RepID=A0ABZ0UTU9_9RICK|nr:hypothetical protein [Candidatus Trichorickettsia mobilis]WPY01221.1 hypothetical protein Trichorick_01127 [Candidatus Trichorickettsia mobilis]
MSIDKYRQALISVILLCLSGCAIETTTIYNKSLTSGYSTSEPIYLGFHDNKNASFYFLLKHKAPSSEYLLCVRWNSPDHEIIFNGTKSAIRFLLDNSNIITLQPVKPPKIIAYNIENKGHIEEAMFNLTADQLRLLASARKVEVELTGKHITVLGTFNRMHTSKAFKDFLDKAG